MSIHSPNSASSQQSCVTCWWLSYPYTSFGTCISLLTSNPRRSRLRMIHTFKLSSRPSWPPTRRHIFGDLFCLMLMLARCRLLISHKRLSPRFLSRCLSQTVSYRLIYLTRRSVPGSVSLVMKFVQTKQLKGLFNRSAWSDIQQCLNSLPFPCNCTLSMWLLSRKTDVWIVLSLSTLYK